CAILILFWLLLPACSPVSDEEVKRLRAENEALSQELMKLREEGRILDSALTNAYREKDRILALIKTIESGNPLPENWDNSTATPPETQPEATLAPPTPRVYKVQRGDNLSQIAKDNNITLPELLKLNPFLTRRPELLLMEEDLITLPN
ncbi:MAG: LysM peptidoglycan-binding domain-containing protein, partial [Deltaproteobacteria bacterium]|nr:LysM peptidoglycan-binding domain-containing protein [Deltaproteobacteria bacterium]